MDYQSIVTFVMEMAGSVAFAASGAMVGVERNMDIFGVSVLGVATAVSGILFWGSSLRLYLPILYMHWCQCLLPALFSLFFISRENCFRGTGVRPTIKSCWQWTLSGLGFLQ